MDTTFSTIPPSVPALGALCRVYELPRDACSREHMDHAKLMSFVPRLWERSLLVVDLDRLQVSVSATSLLSACHRLTLPAAEASGCLAPVTLLCRLLLSSTHWLVRHKALEAFKDFAQVLTLLLCTPLRTPCCSARPAV